MDAAVDNPRAILAWEKAGFGIEREWPDHPDGPSLLMRLPGRPAPSMRDLAVRWIRHE